MRNYIKGIITGIIIVGAAVCPANALARVTGTVLSTNIGTVIDGAACKTYNVDGRTFVIAEDLRGYGFDVEWNENTRNLSITQNPYAHRTLLSEEETNIKKEDCPVGNPLMDILSSDVTVTVAGGTVEGYNIDGQMVIPVRALEPYAYIEFDEENRLVKIQGLKHYLDTRYAEGNPNTTRDIKEYVQHVSHVVKSTGGSIMEEYSNFYDTDVREETTIDTENGKITAYFGNPLTQFSPAGRYNFESCSDREIYSITDADGNWIYEADLLYRNDPLYRYIVTGNQGQIIVPSISYLYGYFVDEENNHYNHWLSKEEINAPDMRFTKLIPSGQSSVYALSENGFLYYITDYQSEERSFQRYNIADTFYGLYGDYMFIANDGVLYEAGKGYCAVMETSTNAEDNPQINSVFDKVIATNVKAAICTSKKNIILDKDGKLYFGDVMVGNNIRDIVGAEFFDSKKILTVLDNDNNLFCGSFEDYENGTQKHIADNVNNIQRVNSKTSSTSTIFYITHDNTLYTYNYPNDTPRKEADNISKVIKSYVGGGYYYITTDGVLTDLKNDYLHDVKDAYHAREDNVDTKDIFYLLKTDGTLWYMKTGEEPQRVKAFE